MNVSSKIVFDGALAEARAAIAALRRGVEREETVVKDDEEIVFVSLRKAFTELAVSARSEGSFASIRTELEEIRAIMAEALEGFVPDSSYRKPLELLKGILSLSEEVFLSAKPDELFAHC